MPPRAAQEYRRGRARLTLLLPLLDGLAESPGESVSRGVIVWSGFEPPVLQMVFSPEGHDDRADFAWASIRGVGESDGYGKYIGDSRGDGCPSRRGEEARGTAAPPVRRLDRWDMTEALAVTPLIARLDRMGVPRVAPPRTGLLLTSTLRSTGLKNQAEVEKPNRG